MGRWQWPGKGVAVEAPEANAGASVLAPSPDQTSPSLPPSTPPEPSGRAGRNDHNRLPARPDADAEAPGGEAGDEAPQPSPWQALLSAQETEPVPQPDRLDEVKFRVHKRLIQELETARLDKMAPEEAQPGVEAAARQIIQQEAPGIFGVARDELVIKVVDEVLGLGPIEPLMRDPTISEVMVNGPEIVYFERGGRLNRANVRFRDTNHIMRICERIISPLGRRVDESSPMVDARLPDGSRVNIIIPPVAPKSPSITIRKFKADKMKMEDLVAVGCLTEEAAMFLAACVRIKRNVIISGGTGSGKTTQLNALSAFIPESERIVTIEDPTELRLQQTHVVSLEARPPSAEGRGEVTPQQLVKNALRMRPDRIIIGECRGGEAFDMLQAMNTGHEGSLSTVHANSPRDALARIESMVLMTGMDLPLSVVRQQIASAVQVIIQVARFSDGSRRISYITEITGMESGVITTQDLFKFENDGLDENKRVLGMLRAQGIRPSFAPLFELSGIDMPPYIFTGSHAGW